MCIRDSDHYLRFEIKSRGEPQELVSWTSITIGTTMLATAIGIDAGFEADIRTVIVSNDRAGGVVKKSGCRRRILRRIPIRIALEMEVVEAISRVAGRAAAANDGRIGLH